MSFIDYKINHEKKNLDKCILISMSGLKLNIVKHTLKTFKGKLQPVVCVDNDNAGRAFMKKLDDEKICYITRLPEADFKDWNEQLIAVKRNSKPISRLMNRGLTSNQSYTNNLSHKENNLSR